MRTTDIAISSPCGADWRTMKPSDKKRFCDACKKHVHDLSAMTKDEASEVLASPPLEGLCVRYLYDEHGEVVFRTDIVAPSVLVRARRLAAFATFPVALTACMGAVPTPPPQVMMGAVACPMPPPASGSVAEPAPVASGPAVTPSPKAD